MDDLPFKIYLKRSVLVTNTREETRRKEQIIKETSIGQGFLFPMNPMNF